MMSGDAGAEEEKTKKLWPPLSAEHKQELERRLLDLAKALAKTERKPYYTIFSSRTLVVLARDVPTDLATFRKCERVTARLHKKYGQFVGPPEGLSVAPRHRPPTIASHCSGTHRPGLRGVHR